MDDAGMYEDPLADPSDGYLFDEFEMSGKPPRRRTLLAVAGYGLLAALATASAAVSASTDTDQRAAAVAGVCAVVYLVAALDGALFNKPTPTPRFVTAPKIVRLVCFAAATVAAWHLAVMWSMP